MNQPFRFPHRKTYFLFAIFTAILFLVMCEEESSEPRSYPRLSGIQITNISNEGATFNADLYSLGSAVISQHGFIWGSSKSLDMEVHDRIYLGPLQETGVFSAEVRSALSEGQDYFVRPFVKTPEKIIYGPVASFKSLGSLGPVITNFQPDSAGWGDTLIIRGKNFSWNENAVYVNQFRCATIRNSDTLIKAVVPLEVNTIDNAIYVEVAKSKKSIDKRFRLILPRIEEIEPKQAFWGDIITIKGKYLSSYMLRSTNFFQFGTVKSSSVSSTNDINTFKIRVPDELNALSNQITCFINGISVKSSDRLSLVAPHFTFTPSEGTWRNTVTLKGRFHPVASRNTITIGGNEATISAFTKDSIKVTVPLNTGNYKNAVALKVTPFTVTSQDSFRLYKPLISSIYPLTSRSNGTVTIRGRYLHAGTSYYYPTVSTVVRFGNQNLPINSIKGDSVLVCTIPYDVTSTSSALTVTVGNQSVQSSEILSIINPFITDFNPKNATFNDLITIKGKYFMPTQNASSPFVYFGRNSATVVSFNDSVVVAKVPVAVDSIPCKIKIQADAAASRESSQEFTLTPPAITGVIPNPVTTAGSDITINGTGFNPVISGNKVYWDNYPLTIKSATNSQIVATLPVVMTRNDSRVNVIAGGYKRGFPVSNDIISKWNKVADFSAKPWAGAGGWSQRPVSFSINGIGYFMDLYGSMLSFNPLDASVVNVSSANTLAYKAGLASVVFRDTAYIMGHNLGLYRFDIVTGAWISKGISPPIPGNNFFGAFFTLQGKLYYGVAFSDYGVSSYGNLNRSFWVFDESSKTWKPKQSLPAITTNPIVNYFTMNDKGYILFSDNKFCEYDPVSDTWTRLKDYPVNMYYYGKVAIVLNNKAYVGLGTDNMAVTSDQIYVYDRSLDLWTLYDKIPYGARTNSCTFVINGKGYVAGGNKATTTTVIKDILEFDPAF